MASSIDATKPTAGAALTADVRNNFSAAKTEIEALQADAAVHVSAADPHPGYALDADLTAGLATKLNLTGGTLSGWLKMAVGSGHYLYNLDTDASNYERGFMRWNANVFEIGTEALGTGSNRALWLKAMGSTIKWDGNSFQWGTTAAMFASGLSLASNVIVGWSNTYNGGLGGYSTAIGRSASGLVEITNGDTGAYRDLILRNLTAAGYQELGEMTAPAAPATNNVRIYAEDNGAGKTRIMALFSTGAAVQVAIEP